jgi:dihydrofolate reductase
MLVALWAQDKNGLIGKDNQLPWSLPADLKFFKETTIGNTIVMGRKTFEGMGKRVLPSRQTIVLTRDKNYQSEGVLVMHTVEEILDYAKQAGHPVYIIGGALIFKDYLPYCDQLLRTMIDEEFDGDIYMPEIDWSQWELVQSTEGVVDEKNKYAHRYETFERK